MAAGPIRKLPGQGCIPGKTKTLRIDVEVLARLEVINPFDFFIEEYAEMTPFSYDQHLLSELGPCKDLRMDTPVELVNQEYPHTLDLRQFWKSK